MSGDANNHGAGTSAAGAQGPAGTPYATAGPPRPGDVSGQQQTTAYADAGVASVVNQFAGMGLGASVPMQGYHIAQPAVYPPMFSYSGMGLHGPGFVMQDANGNSYPSNDFQAPTVDNRFYSDYLHKMGNFQQELHQAPVNPREGMMKYYENLGLRGMRSELTPSLDKRRSSYSTNESTPATPFYGSTASREAGARVAVFDRGSSAYTTPSPPQLTSTGLVVQPKGFSPIPAPIPAPVSREIQQLLIRDPAIPQAVPAVFTPRENMKTLEQSLTNSIPGNRNVYIRGLHPTTDDDLLLAYTDRFGEVETSKAIIDTATGACKG